MPENSRTGFDRFLGRAEKIAIILLPLIIAVVAGVYTNHKDKTDEKAQEQQARRDLAQKRYANLTALLPMLVSKDPGTVSAALEVYIAETKMKQAPESLKAVILRIQQTQPEHMAEAQAAVQAAELQSTGKCQAISGGLFIQVASDKDQLKNAWVLEELLKSAEGIPPIQGVQRVDAVPQQTQLRYYFNESNNADAMRIIHYLEALGYKDIQTQDLSGRYLNVGCPPPPTFELWIGSDFRVGWDGKARAAFASRLSSPYTEPAVPSPQ
jgi:hypothetical protein